MATAEDWKRRVADWRAGGVSAREFAKRRGFSAKSLAWWAWSLGKRESKRSDRKAITRAPSRKVAFVEVIERAAPAIAETAIEIALGSGRVVRVKRGFDRATLRTVIASLEES